MYKSTHQRNLYGILQQRWYNYLLKKGLMILDICDNFIISVVNTINKIWKKFDKLYERF